MQGLSSEEKERLSRVRPKNIEGNVMLLRYAKRTWGREGQGVVGAYVAGKMGKAEVRPEVGWSRGRWASWRRTGLWRRGEWRRQRLLETSYFPDA